MINLTMFSSLVGLLLLTTPQALGFAIPGLNPSVTVRNGTIVGSSTAGIDNFLGIPYLQPPTGNNRLRQPKFITKTFGTISATATPSYCPQYTAASTFSAGPVSTPVPNPPGAVGLIVSPIPKAQQSENCLYLNVQRPTGTTASSKLPVLVWIHGGAFLIGGIGLYNAQTLLLKSVELGVPFVFVAMNYRLGSLGFLPGRQISQEGNANLGLRDQRAAIEWVQENIAAFGGDPDQVTLFGESAGAWSVTDHTLINGGDNRHRGKALFRSVIQDSGAIYPALDVRHAKPQATFNLLVQKTGCRSSNNPLACLRNLPLDSLIQAQNDVVLDGGSINFPFIARPDASSSFFSRSPEKAVALGAFARVPTIAFNQEDEGTLFGLQNPGVYNDDEALLSLFAPIFPAASKATLVHWFDTYPTDPSSGSPYRTGMQNEVFPGYKRLSAMLGDVMFILMRRIYLDVVSGQQKVWSGLQTYDHATPTVGTTHASDVLALYEGLGSPVAIAELQTRILSFVKFQDPNAIGLQLLGDNNQWPRYSTGQRQLLSVNEAGTTILPDTFRSASYQFLKSHVSEFQI